MSEFLVIVVPILGYSVGLYVAGRLDGIRAERRRRLRFADGILMRKRNPHTIRL